MSNEKEKAIYFMKNLLKLNVPAPDDSRYKEKVAEIVPNLLTMTLKKAFEFLMQCGGEYYDRARKNPTILGTHLEVLYNLNSHFVDIKRGADTIILAKKYKRLDKLLVPAIQIKLDADEIGEFASHLSYLEAVNFIGELWGAVILSMPEIQVRIDASINHQNIDWVETDNEIIFYLARMMDYTQDAYIH